MPFLFLSVTPLRIYKIGADRTLWSIRNFPIPSHTCDECLHHPPITQHFITLINTFLDESSDETTHNGSNDEKITIHYIRHWLKLIWNISQSWNRKQTDRPLWEPHVILPNTHPCPSPFQTMDPHVIAIYKYILYMRRLRVMCHLPWYCQNQTYLSYSLLANCVSLKSLLKMLDLNRFRSASIIGSTHLFRYTLVMYEWR